MQKHDWDIIKSHLKQAQRILISTHISPDGDGLGAEAALYHALKKLGKEPFILNCSVLPPEYSFLNNENIFNTYSADKHLELLSTFDLLVILDAGGLERLGPLGKQLSNYTLPTICIDHHPNGNGPAVAMVVDTEVAAAVCLVSELLGQLAPQVFDKTIAEALYVGLMTDTGSFRFENTTATALRQAADWIEYGVNPAEIYRFVYESYSPARMRLLGDILQHINFELDNRLAWFKVTKKQIEAAGAVIEEVDGFTEFVRSIQGVEIAIMFLEVREKRTRLNFRSKGKLSINGVARYFGGGGHPNAAGVVLDMNIEEAIAAVLPQVRLLFQSSDVIESPRLSQDKEDKDERQI